MKWKSMTQDLGYFLPAVWVKGEALTLSWQQDKWHSMSQFLLGTLKYLWYKYCKALRLIKALVFINEVTKGSIDQAFFFMPGGLLSSATTLFVTHSDTLCSSFTHLLSASDTHI